MNFPRRTLCLAVGLVLFHRLAQLHPEARMDMRASAHRGWYESDDDDLRTGANA